MCFGGSPLIFQKKISPPYSGFMIKARKKPIGSECSLLLVSCLAYSSTLKMGAICSSETTVDSHQTTQHYNPIDLALQIVKFVSIYSWFI
jgi:hypothetical protein